jgi:hypothetical protein
MAELVRPHPSNSMSECKCVDCVDAGDAGLDSSTGDNEEVETIFGKIFETILETTLPWDDSPFEDLGLGGFGGGAMRSSSRTSFCCM